MQHYCLSFIKRIFKYYIFCIPIKYLDEIIMIKSPNTI